MTQITAPVRPTPRDTELARSLTAKLERDSNLSLNELPQPVVALVQQILEEMGNGRAVSLSALPDELTTQEAASVLGVSRPFVVKLMDQGFLAYRKVGSHRRVMLTEVLAYLDGTRVRRLNALAELTAEAQELGLGY